MKRFFLILIGVIFLVGLFVGYRFYCNKIIEDIRDEFLSVFIEGVSEENKDQGYLQELKNKLYERKNFIVRLESETEENFDFMDETLSILPEEDIRQDEMEREYLYYDDREITSEIGSLIYHNSFYYSNSNLIYLDDLDFSEHKIVQVIFKNYITSLYAEDYPMSYKNIMNSEEYHYYFTYYKRENGVYNIYFQNENKSNTVVITVDFKLFIKPVVTLNYLYF